MSKADFIRLCNVTRIVPRIKASTAADLLKRLRNLCLEGGNFHPLSLGQDKEGVPLARGAFDYDYDYYYYYDDDDDGDDGDGDDFLPSLPNSQLCEAVVALLDTPRKLQRALGQTYRAWEHRGLKGEIDWDDLFAINVLRVAAPTVWSFLIQWYDVLSEDTPAASTTASRQAIASSLPPAWQAAIQSGNLAPLEEYVLALVHFCFPKVQKFLLREVSIKDPRHRTEQPPQRIRYARYWYRAINETVEGVRDQEVLWALHKWIENDDPHDLACGIRKKEGYVEVFSWWFRRFAKWAQATPADLEKKIERLFQSLLDKALQCKEHLDLELSEDERLRTEGDRVGEFLSFLLRTLLLSKEYESSRESVKGALHEQIRADNEMAIVAVVAAIVPLIENYRDVSEATVRELQTWLQDESFVEKLERVSKKMPATARWRVLFGRAIKLARGAGNG